MGKGTLPPLPMGYQPYQPDEEIPPLPSGYSAEPVKKKDWVSRIFDGGEKPTNGNGLSGGLLGKAVQPTEREQLTNYLLGLKTDEEKKLSQPKAITTGTIYKKPENLSMPIDEKSIVNAQKKLGDIMYGEGEGWKDPMGQIRKGIIASDNMDDVSGYGVAQILTEKSLMPDGFDAKRALSSSTFSGAGKDNLTAETLRNRVDEYEKTVAPFRDINPQELTYLTKDKLYDAAIRAYANNNTNFKKQLEAAGIDINKEDISLSIGDNNAKRGQIMSVILQNPDLHTFLEKENPDLIPALKDIQENLIYDNKDYGKVQIANEISRDMQSGGYNKIDPIFNLENSAKKTGDITAEALYANDPKKLQFYRENKDDILNKLDAPSLFMGFAEAGKGFGRSILNTFTQPFTSPSKTMKEGWEKEASHVSADPKGLVKFLSDSGHALGFVASIGATGNVFGAAGLSPNAASMTSLGVGFLGDNLEQAKMKYPDSPVKQWTSALFNTGLFMAMGKNLFPAAKVEQALTKVQPGISKVIDNLASGSITREAARAELNTWGKKAIDIASEGLQKNLKVSAEMTGITILNKTLDRLMGMDDQTFQQFHPEGEEADTFKSMFLSNIIVNSMAAYGQVKAKNNIAKESIYEAATNPNRYRNIIESSEISKNVTDTKDMLDNLDYITGIKKDLDARGLSEKQKKDYLLNALKSKVLNASKPSSPDATLTRQYSERIKDLEEINQGILEGKDADEVITTSEQKGIDEMQKKVDEGNDATAEIEKLTKNQELDNKEIDTKISQLEKKDNPLYGVQKERLEQQKKEYNDYYNSAIKKLSKPSLIAQAIKAVDKDLPEYLRAGAKADIEAMLREAAEQLNSSESEAKTARSIYGETISDIALKLYPDAKTKVPEGYEEKLVEITNQDRKLEGGDVAKEETTPSTVSGKEVGSGGYVESVDAINRKREKYGLEPLKPTYRGTSKAEWDSVQNGEPFKSKTGFGDNESNTTWVSDKKEYSDEYFKSNEDGVLVEFKPEAIDKSVVESGQQGDDTGVRLGRNLKLEDVQRVTDKNGNVIYEAPTKEVKAEQPIVSKPLENSALRDVESTAKALDAKKADIERRRQEELKAVPVGSSTMYKYVKDSANTELTEEEQNTVEELIQAFVENGETDVNKVVSYLQRQGFIRGAYVSIDAQKAYIQARLNGTNIPVNGRVQESINAKYDAELKALEQSTSTNQSESNPALRDVESTAKALEGASKSNPTIWQQVKDFVKGTVKRVGDKLGIVSNEQHISNFEKAKAEWDKLSSREKKLKRADYELDDLHHSEGGYYKVGNSLIDLDLNSNHLKLLLENNKFLGVLNKLGVTKIHGENRPPEEMFAHYSDGKIHLNNNSNFENIRQVTNAMSHELGHHEWTKLTKEERDYVRTLPLETGMAKHYEAQEKSGKGKETSASLQEENFADYVMQYFQGKLYGDEALLNKIPTKLRELFDNKYSDLLKDNEHSEIAEAYHKAKADGSNPELVKAVESLLSKEQTPTALRDVESTAKALEEVNEVSHKPLEDIGEKLYQPKYVDENTARDVIESFTHYKSGSNKYPATKWARWFQSVDANAKKDIVDDIKNNPELRNSMLSLLYDLYKKEIGFDGSFEDFILTPIKLFRGVTDADKKGKGQEGFSAYSISKNRVSGYAHNRSSNNPEVKEVTVRPIDTYGAVNYIMGAEVEVLLPQNLSKETLQKEFNRLVELNIGEFSENQRKKLEEYYTNDDYIGGVQYAKSIINGSHKTISEAYHKAKIDGSNPELVKAVESLLSKEQATQEAKAEQPTVLGKEEGSGGDADFTAKGGNKVVDDKGEPITLYHSTFKEFDDFNDGVNYFSEDADYTKYISKLMDGGRSEGKELKTIPVNIKASRIFELPQGEEMNGNKVKHYLEQPGFKEKYDAIKGIDLYSDNKITYAVWGAGKIKRLDIGGKISNEFIEKNFESIVSQLIMKNKIKRIC